MSLTNLARCLTVILNVRPVMTIAMNMRTLPFQVAILVSQNHPLRGKAAGNSMRQHLAKMSNKAAEEGLTEADVRRMLHEIPQSNTAFRHSV
jgi:hypothetical protein